MAPLWAKTNSSFHGVLFFLMDSWEGVLPPEDECLSLLLDKGMPALDP